MNFSSAEGLGGAGAVMSQRSALYGNSLQRIETAYKEGWRSAMNKYFIEHGMSGMVDTTDANGNFEVNVKDTPWENKGILVRDIDGAKNGSFESEFDTIKQGDEYVCGNGANEYEFETVDGDIFVKKLS